MQRLIRFCLLLPLFTVVFTGGADAGLFDYFGTKCKKIDSEYGMSLWKQDSRKFRLADFRSGLCYGATVPQGKTYCVKMTSVQVHDIAQAIQLAKEYALARNNDNIACHPAYLSCQDNDDHILCATANNSARYEFVFDDITEVHDAKYKQGIGTAACQIHMGDDFSVGQTSGSQSIETYNDAMMCYTGGGLEKQIRNMGSDANKNPKAGHPLLEISNKIDKTLSGFGYSAEYVGWDNAAYKYGTRIDFKTAKNCDTNLVTRFQEQQINLDNSVIAWLAGYWSHNMTEELETFTCNLAPTTCKTGDMFNPHDDVLTCYANGKEVKFRFDDLSETKNTYKQGAASMMQCMSDGNVFDGKRCHGPTQQQCDELNTQVPGGTKWDDEWQACVLLSAAKATERRDLQAKVTNVGTSVVILAAVIVAEVVTAGGATAAIAVLGTTSSIASGVAVVSAGASEYFGDKQKEKAEDYMKRLKLCDNAKCATELIEEYIQEVSYYNKLTMDQIETMDVFLSDAMEKLVKYDQAKFLSLMKKIDERTTFGKYLGKDVPTVVKAQVATEALAILADLVSLKAVASPKLTKTATTMISKTNKFFQHFKTATGIADKTDIIKDMEMYYVAHKCMECISI